MTDNPIPFMEMKTQFTAIESEIRAAIDTVLESGWFVLGEQVRAFESEFAEYLGVEHAIAVGSGTDAIQLALTALDIGAGDEVITAANTCVPTVAGILATGATPVLADICLDTYTIDPAAVEDAVTERTRAVVPVHLYGHSCDMAPLLDAARSHGIAVVEDCAQCHGARYRDQRCGTIGDAGAFSFYPSKNLGAYGDGGAVVTRDGAVAARLRMLRNYGQERRYHHTVKGINSRLDELQAAILRVKLKYLDQWNRARRERAAVYCSELDGCSVTCPVEAEWAWHIYHLFVIRSAARAALQAHLEACGIATLIHYPVPIHLEQAYADLGGKRGAFPNAERACAEVLSLPMYPELPLSSVRRVAEAVRAFTS